MKCWREEGGRLHRSPGGNLGGTREEPSRNYTLAWARQRSARGHWGKVGGAGQRLPPLASSRLYSLSLVLSQRGAEAECQGQVGAPATDVV